MPQIELDRHEYREPSRRPWLPYEKMATWPLLFFIAMLVIGWFAGGHTIPAVFLTSALFGFLTGVWTVGKFRRRFFDIED